MQSKNINNIIAVLAVVVVAVAVLNLSVTFMKVSEFEKTLTGYATGYVNITVSSNIQINLTNSSVDFLAGAVNASCDSAILYTRGRNLPVIICGNWSTHSAAGVSPHGIAIENTGNINCTLTANSSDGSVNGDWIGGTAGAGATYQWNVTMSESGSCAGGITKNVWRTANSTQAATLCTDFSSVDAGDEVMLDVNLSIPADATTGALSDTITIAASPQS